MYFFESWSDAVTWEEGHRDQVWNPQPPGSLADNVVAVFGHQFPHLCTCLAAKLRPTLCNPMDCSMLGFPVLHHLPEFAQTREQNKVIGSAQLMVIC